MRTVTNDTTRRENVHIELRGYQDGATMAHAPNGKRFRIECEPRVVRQLLSDIAAGTPASEALALTPDPDGYAAVVETLRGAGCVGDVSSSGIAGHWARFDSPAIEPVAIAGTRLLLLGDAMLTDVALQVVEGCGFRSADVVGIRDVAEAAAA